MIHSGLMSSAFAATLLMLPQNSHAAAFAKPSLSWPVSPPQSLQPFPPAFSGKPPFSLPSWPSGFPTLPSGFPSLPSDVPTWPIPQQPGSGSPANNSTIGKPVNTTSGLVHGHAAPNATGVSEYLGIPFAKPPIGDLRFAPPERFYGSGNLSGESTSKICPQSSFSGLGSQVNVSAVNASTFPLFLEGLGGLDQVRDEDCLTINVWTKWGSGSAPKPVMVWIYGGGFATGSSNASAYSGQYFADEDDVVFVNFNYRLGIFGFSGAPGLTQNVGLLDQRLALEWVRDNAEAFGGDASRIILFGESAGAASTDYYTYAWTEDPIIAGSISESGQVNSFGNKEANTQASRWYSVAESFGCGNESSSTPEEVVACMRDPTKITTDALLNNSTGTGPFSLILAQFGPTIDNKTVFSNYTQRVIDGDFIKKPALLGSNDNEAGIFILIFGLFGIKQSDYAWNALTQSVFTCPANSAAYARYLHNVPVWRYRYFPSFPNIQIPTSVGRAYHLSEVFPLFNTDQDISGQDSTATERAIGKYLRDAWASFAHDPAGALGGGQFNWPQYSPDLNATKGLVLLGRENHTTADFGVRGEFDGPACTQFYQGIPGF